MSKIKTSIGTYVEDITGQTFNRLTALELTDKKDSDNRWLWKCQCSCDNKTIIYTSMHKLKTNNTKSCGCLQKESVIKKNKANALDITNQRKGTLTAIKQVGHSSSGNIWQIKCDCGNIFTLIIGEWNRDQYGDGNRARYTCPLCSTNSKGQLALRTLFCQHNILAQEEWTDSGQCKNPITNGTLRFDFYLPDYNCCIEYDGEQHFKANGRYFTDDFVKEVQYRDKIKEQYCQNHHIKLIRIPYTDFNKISMRYLNEKGVFNE